VIRHELLAHRWHHALVGVVILWVLGLTGRHELVRLPVVSGSIPAPLVIMLVAVLVVCTPLQASFPTLAATLPREALARSLRTVVATGLAVVAYLPASWGEARSAADLDVGDWPRLIVLVALGIGATVVIGEHSWILVVSGGVLALIVDGSHPGRPVSHLLAGVGPLWLGVALVGAAVAYAVRGPRSSA
jgi:hypothetical protein